MFAKLHNRFGTAGLVVAVVALIAALAGTAIAAGGLNAKQKKELTPKLEALIKPPGFTGQAPGGPSRWSTERSAEWKPLANKLVVEVQYDHFTGGRFRHGTRFLRWRPDKAPKQCTLDQVRGEKSSALKLLKKR